MENRNNNPIAEEIIHNNPTGYGLFAGIGDNFNSAARVSCAPVSSSPSTS